LAQWVDFLILPQLGKILNTEATDEFDTVSQQEHKLIIIITGSHH